MSREERIADLERRARETRSLAEGQRLAAEADALRVREDRGDPAPGYPGAPLLRN